MESERFFMRLPIMIIITITITITTNIVTSYNTRNDSNGSSNSNNTNTNSTNSKRLPLSSTSLASSRQRASSAGSMTYTILYCAIVNEYYIIISMTCTTFTVGLYYPHDTILPIY